MIACTDTNAMTSPRRTCFHASLLHGHNVRNSMRDQKRPNAASAEISSARSIAR